MNELKNCGLKVNENDFKQYETRILEQRKLRKYKVSDLDKYLRLKDLFSLPVDVHIKKLTSKRGLDIWLVDGTKVRSNIDIDFTTGGHGLRYLYVPINEIWIDSAISDIIDVQTAIEHEILELSLMKRGMHYYKAHDIACIIEAIQRENMEKKNGNNDENNGKEL